MPRGLPAGRAGVLHGTRSLVLQDPHGNIELTHSISAGLDYASVGPEHAWLAANGSTEYTWIDDADALEGFQWLARQEGILPALESSHAIAWAAARSRVAAAGHDCDCESLGTRRQGRRDRQTPRVGRAASDGARRREPLARNARLAAAFERLRRDAVTGLVTYVTAGDPDLARSRDVVRGARARGRRCALRLACRSRIRSPTVRRSNARPSARWPPAVISVRRWIRWRSSVGDRGADRALYLRESGAVSRGRGVHRRAAAMRVWMACCCWICR